MNTIYRIILLCQYNGSAECVLKNCKYKIIKSRFFWQNGFGIMGCHHENSRLIVVIGGNENKMFSEN